SKRRELVLVEGLLDVHQLQARGMANVAAVGGARVQPGTIARLREHGIETVVLAFDNDPPGRDGLAWTITGACRAKDGPALRVLEPAWLGDSKDPDAYVRKHGVEQLRALVDRAGCAVTWRALELTRGVTPQHGELARRAALDEAGSWLG